MASAEEHKQIVRSAYEEMAGGNPQPFLGSMHPEVELHEPAPLPYGGTYRGHDEVIGFMRQAAEVMEPGKLEIDELIAEGDRVVSLIRLGLKDGREVLVTEHWLFEDGKAVELRVFWFDPTTPGAPA